MKYRTRLSWCSTCLGAAAASILVAACGSGAPPPKTADDTTLLEEPGSEGAGAGGEAAPASSAKVEQGIDAIQAGDFERAKMLLSDAAQADPDDPQAAYYLGLADEQLGDTAAARADYERALKLDPELVEARVNLSALLLDAGDPEAALEVAEAGLATAPKHSGLLLNRALALSAGGKVTEAVGAFHSAVEASPDDDDVRYLYAEALASAKKKDESLAELERLTESKDPAVLASTARLFALLGAFDRCVGALDKAVDIKPAAELYVHRGLCRHEVGDEAGARKDYEAAIAADPGFAPAHFYLAQHFKAAGDSRKAKTQLEKVVSLAADSKLGRAAKKMLAEL